jgi:hypothetical protein
LSRIGITLGVKRLLLVVALLALAGCGSSSGPKAEWSGPAPATADGTLTVGDFNDFLAGDGQSFAVSPVLAATEFLRLDQVDAGKTTIVSTAPGEVRDQATVVVTLDQLLDDSVRATRYEMELDRPDSDWRLSSANLAYRCRPGRGHAAFSTQPCT